MNRREYEPCERCGSPAVHWHHALHGRRAGHPEWDTIYNLEHLCKVCHDNKGGYEERQAFFTRQANRYGDDFLDWWDGVRVPGKENYY